MKGYKRVSAFGLQLCDGVSSSYGAVRCDSFDGSCQGGVSNGCWANHMWSGTKVSEEYYQIYILSGGSLVRSGCGGAGVCSIRNAFTVRCVLDLTYVLIDF